MGIALVLGVGAAVGGYTLANSSSDDTTKALADVVPAAAVASVVGNEMVPPADTAPAIAAAPVADEGPCGDDMILIQGGKMFMGTDSESPILARARPQHQVEVTDFCIDRTEVTVAAYRECSSVGECKRAYRDSYWPQGSSDEETWKHARKAHGPLCNEAHEDRLDHPVNCVTWTQAKAYCEQEDKALPTEKQWEYAARGSDGRLYPWGDELPDSERMNGCGAECTAWRERVELPESARLYEADDGYPGTAPVASFPAGKSQHGVSDLAGNVFEWTADVYTPYDEVDRLSTPTDTRKKVIRGGAFNSFMPEFADPALRFSQAEDAHSHGIGFRCVALPRVKEG